jgi:hypothetical protein
VKKCFTCQKPGHLAKDCKSSKKDGEVSERRKEEKRSKDRSGKDNPLELKCEGPFPVGLRAYMNTLLKVMRGIQNAGVVAHKTKKKIELARLQPTEKYIVHSKVPGGGAKVFDMHTRQFNDIPRLEELQKCMQLDYNAADTWFAEAQLDIVEQIDATESTREWDGSNRKRLKAELTKWLANQWEQEKAVYREEVAKADTHFVRLSEKVRKTIDDKKHKVSDTMLKLEEEEKKKREEMEQRTLKARARRSLERAESEAAQNNTGAPQGGSSNRVSPNPSNPLGEPETEPRIPLHVQKLVEEQRKALKERDEEILRLQNLAGEASPSPKKKGDTSLIAEQRNTIARLQRELEETEGVRTLKEDYEKGMRMQDKHIKDQNKEIESLKAQLVLAKRD